MPLPVITFNQLQTNMVNACANAQKKVTNFTSGSVALALIQAFAGAIMSLQRTLVHVSNTTRLATSTGSDVTSYLADFSLARLSAVAGTVSLQINRLQATTVQNIPITSIVQSPTTGIQYQLIADTTQSAYSSSLGVYQFGINVFTIYATAQAVVAGPTGNVAANTLTQVVSGFPGISSVTNPLGVTNGKSAESDAAARARFTLYLSSLSKATKGAISYAISSVQNGLTYQILDRQHVDFTLWVAGFTVVVDDGSGAISTTLITSISAAVDAVRAAGIQFAVVAPTNAVIVTTVTVVAQVGYTHANVASAVQLAVQKYINGLGVGVNVSFANLANVIQNTPGVFSYTALLINGTSADIVIPLNSLARSASVTVN